LGRAKLAGRPFLAGGGVDGTGQRRELFPVLFPACLTVYADQRLAETVFDLRNRVENLLSLSSRAYRAITASGSVLGASTNLQIAFKDTIYLFVNHLASSFDGFVAGPNAGHPLDW